MAQTAQCGRILGKAGFVLACLLVCGFGAAYALSSAGGPYHPKASGTSWMSARVSAGVSAGDRAGLPGAAVLKGAARRLAALSADPAIDVPIYVSRVMADLDDLQVGGALESYLIWALNAGKSDAYIDALLNSATLAGDIDTPAAFLTMEGRLDTPSLLAAILLAADPDATVAQSGAGSEQADHHPLRFSDSLAGVSLAYYGHPLDHVRTAAANQDLLRPAEVDIGQVVEVPGD